MACLLLGDNMIKKHSSLFLLSLFLLMMFSGLVSAQIGSDFQQQFDDVQQQIIDAQQQMAEDQEKFDASQVTSIIGLSAGIIGVLSVVFFLIGIIGFIGFIWALFDILGSDNETSWKLLWVVVCLFLNIVGLLLYIFIGRKSKSTGVLKSAVKTVMKTVNESKQELADEKTQSKKFCSSCGNKLDAATTFCSGCGEKQA